MTVPSYFFDSAGFRASFPVFANTTTYPDAVLQGYWNTSGFIIANDNYGDLAGDQRDWILQLMTAHLASLSGLIASGSTPGIVTGASIDKVSVTLEPPPGKTQFQWWLNLTPYGSQLAVILSIASAGGFYAAGGPGRMGFRFSGTC